MIRKEERVLLENIDVCYCDFCKKEIALGDKLLRSDAYKVTVEKCRRSKFFAPDRSTIYVCGACYEKLKSIAYGGWNGEKNNRNNGSNEALAR